ncbi:hypothetical protein [Ornithinimicrobium panacihumi]
MPRLRHLSARKQQGVLTWIPVTGPDGRTRMEMRWQVGPTKAAPRRRSAA